MKKAKVGKLILKLLSTTGYAAVACKFVLYLQPYTDKAWDSGFQKL